MSQYDEYNAQKNKRRTRDIIVVSLIVLGITLFSIVVNSAMEKNKPQAGIIEVEY